MADINIDKNEIVEFMVDYLQLEEFKESVGKLKDIDWNPFDDDGDEFVGVWAEIQHNYDLIWDVAVNLVGVAERIVVGGLSLENEQKHNVVVSALDRALKSPWYLEPFDGVALGMLVTAAVKFLKMVDWGVGEAAALELVEMGGDKPEPKFKEIG
jgi:hypothetical protein